MSVQLQTLTRKQNLTNSRYTDSYNAGPSDGQIQTLDLRFAYHRLVPYWWLKMTIDCGLLQKT